MSPEQITELQGLLKVVRKMPLNFGLCLGKKPEDTVMMLHRTKSPDVLGRQSKQAGETSRVAFGVAEAQGKRLTLKCEGDPPANMAKQLRNFLAAQKAAMKVIIADASGTVLEEDGEDEGPEDEAQGTDTGAPETQADGADPLAARWEATAKAVLPLLDKAAQSGHPNAAKLKPAWDAIVATAAQSNYAEALQSAAKLVPVLQQLAAAAGAAKPAAGPEAARWSGVETQMGDLMRRALALNPDNADQLSKAWDMALKAAGSGDFATALSVAERIRRPLASILSAGQQSAPQPAASKDKVSTDFYIKAMDSVNRQLSALRSALMNSGDPELAAIGDKGLNGITDGHKTRLQAAIFDFNGAEGEARRKAASKVADLADDFLTFLEEDERVEAVDVFNESGVSVSVRGTLGPALERLIKTMETVAA